jgi:hypothetical protein
VKHLIEVSAKGAEQEGAAMHGRKIRNVPGARRREDFALVCFISAVASIVASKAEDFAPAASPMMSLLHGVAQPHRDSAFSADAIASL